MLIERGKNVERKTEDGDWRGKAETERAGKINVEREENAKGIKSSGGK